MAMIGPDGRTCIEHRTGYSWRPKKRVDKISISPEKMHGVFTAVANNKTSLEMVLDRILAYFEQDPVKHRDTAEEMIRLLAGRGRIDPSKNRELYEQAQYTYSEITGGATLPCY